MAITNQEVQDVFGKDTTLSTQEQTKLREIAERMTSSVFGGKVSRFSEIEGDEDDFTTFLAAHLWTIAEGGAVGSSSQTGGSVNYDHLTSNVESGLNETRYGRLCKLMLRESASIGIVRGDR